MDKGNFLGDGLHLFLGEATNPTELWLHGNYLSSSERAISFPEEWQNTGEPVFYDNATTSSLHNGEELGFEKIGHVLEMRFGCIGC